MRRIRLLHLIASSRGGGATHVRDLALGLDRKRFDVRVAMPEDGGTLGRQDFEGVGVPFHRVDIAAGFSLGALRRIRALAAETDILHVHGARAALFGRLAAASLGGRRPLVAYIIQGFSLPYYSFLRRSLMLTTERLLAPCTDAVIAVSQEERQAFLAQRILPRERVSVVLNSVDLAPFEEAEGRRDAVLAELGLPASAVVITTICRLHKPRDFRTLLAAFDKLAGTSALPYLLVVGDGPERTQVEELRAQKGLVTRVVLTGQRLDTPAVLAASDIYTLTTWGWEGLPFTVLEAMAAARPVVATRAGGIPEAVVEGETGLLVPRCDAAALSQAWACLVTDPDLRARMGAAGRERARTVFSRQQMLAQTTVVYDRVIGAAGTTARRSEAGQ